jgi:hypothetical protein
MGWGVELGFCGLVVWLYCLRQAVTVGDAE